MIICGTGHRPNKLGGYTVQAHDRLVKVARYELLRLQPTKVISGMALGWDQALAEAALLLAFPLVAAIPFEGQEKAWPQSSQDLFNEILEECSQLVYVSDPGYAAWKMQKRNEWMVDQSHVVLALWDGSDGGTANCVRYANKMGKPVENAWDVYEAT